MSYHNTSNPATNAQRQTVNAQGQSAPAGFHYMPDGTLMANNDMYGYSEKVIKNFAINTKDIHSDGETRSFTISGDQGAIFSIEVCDDAATRNYYHFDTKLFSSSKPNLCLEELNGPYSFSVKFPAATALHTYTIEVTAHSVDNIKTVHTRANEVRFPDNTINHNASTGSNSNILKKILYQDLVKNLYLSCVAPSKYTASTDQIDGDTLHAPSNRIIIDGLVTDRKIVEVGDKVTVTTDISSTVHALVTAIDPDGDNTNELEIGFADGVTDNAAITFTPAFNGMTPHYTDDTTGRAALTAASGGNLTTSFTITCTALAGRTFSILRAPTINDLCAIIPISFDVTGNSYSSISDEDTSGSTLFYRWQIANIANLSLGMSLDPARTGTGANTTTPATISNYRTTKIIKSITKRKYCTDINDITVDDVFVDGVHDNGNLITAMDRTGRVTARAGNIIFSTQQAAALDDDTSVRIFAYGAQQIRNATGMGITLSNVEVKLTQISTTASESRTSASGLTLASVSNISTASTIRGVGINPSLANPRVTLKTADTGPGDITLDASNTIVSGQTYYFDGASNIATITGTITVSNMTIGDTTLYFDVERFLSAV
jgi:hypothetical protein